MIADSELNSWHQQWTTAADPLPDLHDIRQRIKRQQRRFVIDNLLAGIAFLVGLAFAAFMARRVGVFGAGWAVGISVFLVVSMTYRLWSQRGTWRAEAQSTRAFVELWKRRVAAQVRMLGIARYLAVAWLVVCAWLAVANWATIAPQFKASPAEWLAPLALSSVVLPLIFIRVARILRRKRAELEQVTEILSET